VGMVGCAAVVDSGKRSIGKGGEVGGGGMKGGGEDKG